MHRIIMRMQLDCSSWRQSSGCGSVSISIAHQQYLYSSSSFLAMRRRRRTCRPLMIRVDKDAKAAAVAMENKDQLRRRGVRKCECHDLYDVLVPYTDAWKWQKFLVEGRSATLETKADLVDSVAILQHPSVYTMGTRSSERFLHFDKQSPPFELHRTERGGEVTYHGPGQLVMYPILNLRFYKMDLHWYLRSLEEVVIRAIWSACGIRASRIDGLTGVWIGDQKVAAIGVRVSRWITYHGLAVNVDVDIAPFKNIVPCGIANKSVGNILSLLELGLTSGLQHEFLFRDTGGNYSFEIEASKINDAKALLKVIHQCLMDEFSEVFEVELVVPTLAGPVSLS
ncbi:hypothetical protein O6H91_21G037000 [Diphasiastrum complanatum]|uniref:Uncharacterized protein n=1 Tax=Diphasiastrum complanatum TaxID=34168 RepID=A0ACC2AJG9_DIPCM|nr:hypothetical protein O6H91_21G037000 [Diphasiastrum complanatum]